MGVVGIESGHRSLTVFMTDFYVIFQVMQFFNITENITKNN